MLKEIEKLSIFDKEKLIERTQPSWINPMLATLSRQAFSETDWIYEPKLDGFRCLTFRKGDSIELLSRNKISLNSRYPELIRPLKSQKVKNYILDGEIVAFKNGLSSFSALQRRVIDEHEPYQRKVKIHYFIFDLMYVDQFDVTKLDVLKRKELLKHIFSFPAKGGSASGGKDLLQYVSHRPQIGTEYYQEACKLGWEGIIAKHATSIYEAGRSREWLKFKCSNRQEFVIGGYTHPKGMRFGFGSLLLGYYQNGTLIYAGKVGTGFDQDLLEELTHKLTKLKSPISLYKDLRGIQKDAIWVRPELVAEIAFTEWTPDGRLRHPVFLGLRIDKKAQDIVKEKSAAH